MTPPKSRLRELLETATKFGVVGLLTIGVYFAALFALEPLIQSVIILTASAYVLSGIFNYTFQSRITFRATSLDRGNVLRYLIMHAFCMGLNSLLMFILVSLLLLNLYISQLFVTFVVAATSFTLSKLWVYQN